eukprot:349644-Chlamydomonas_euryale.AAC.4
MNGEPIPDSLSLFGQIVLVVYMVTVAILLLNLLVAIIVLRYEPEAVVAQTKFSRAQIVEYYQIQVGCDFQQCLSSCAECGI